MIIVKYACKNLLAKIYSKNIFHSRISHQLYDRVPYAYKFSRDIIFAVFAGNLSSTEI